MFFTITLILNFLSFFKVWGLNPGIPQKVFDHFNAIWNELEEVDSEDEVDLDI